MRVTEPVDNHDEAFRMGVAAYCDGNYRQAIRLLQAAGRGDDVPGQMAAYYHAMSHRALGLEALRDGRYVEAQKHLRTAMHVLGESADLSAYLAMLYARTARPGKCAEELDKAQTRHGAAPARCRQLAMAQWQAARRVEAYMTLESAVRKFPQDAALQAQLGLLYASEGQYERAAPLLERATVLDGAHVEARHWLGLVQAARGDVAAAVRSFQRALELRPSDLSIAYQLSLAARAAKEAGRNVVLRLPPLRVRPTAESRAGQLAAALASEPEMIEAFLDVPAMEGQEEIFEALLAAAKAALADHPNYADLHYQCGRLLDRLRQAASARAHLEQAVRINGRYVKARIELARQLSAGGELDEAMEHLRAALDCGADWPDVHCLAGEILCRRGQAAEGRRHLVRALQLNGRYLRAAQALEAMESRAA